MRDAAHVVSISSGKDSEAVLLLALSQFPDATLPVFADTGNEHELVYAHLDYLEQKLGIKINHVRADFTDRIAGKAEWVRTKWPVMGISDDKVERALAVLKPTGNPYLDLCVWKGRFPSRMAQFCTQELKTGPLVEFQLWVQDTLDIDVWSWQGVRRDESFNRRNALGFETLGGGIYVWRPIAGWTAQQVVAFVKSFGLELNPLYSQGMNRVGCMPCINASKAEIAEISRRFPEHVERLAEWEAIVKEASKRDGASFFPAPDDGRGDMRGRDIVAYVKWAKTFRGGKVADPQWDEPAGGCSSSYGLCDQGGQ